MKLHLPRSERGICLPNIRAYNIACLLQIGLDWLSKFSHYSNYLSESTMALPYSLAALLHCKWKSIPSALQQNLLLWDTAIAWRETRKSLKLSPFMCRYLPIQYNPNFPQGMEHKSFLIWKHKGLRNFSQLCNTETGRPKSFSAIAETFSLP